MVDQLAFVLLVTKEETVNVVLLDLLAIPLSLEALVEEVCFTTVDSKKFFMQFNLFINDFLISSPLRLCWFYQASS